MIIDDLKEIVAVAKENNIVLDGENFVELVKALAEDAKSVAFTAGLEGVKQVLATPLGSGICRCDK